MIILRISRSYSRYLFYSKFTDKILDRKRLLENTCSLHKHYNTNTKREEKCYNLVIVGGGITGLAVAQEILTRNSKLKVAVVEKECELASHQSGHNSGVIHAGVYYKPGSLRAQLCVKGLKLMYEYCDKHGIPYKKCGKLIVATNELEVGRLHDLYERAIANCVPDVELIGGSEIKKIEKYCHGLKAIHSPHTGIVDYAQVARKYGSEFMRIGGDIHLNYNVTSFSNISQNSDDVSSRDFPILVNSKDGNKSIRAAYVLTCGGLYSDKLAEMTGESASPKIIPFRGEYLLLDKSKQHFCKGNIYPVPDPKYPFLGVHFTPRMDGSVWLGPNAMLAFAKEGYRFWDVNIRELFDTLKYVGFQKFILKNLSTTFLELKKSALLQYQVAELKKYVPQITIKDIRRGPSGVRAQAMDTDGGLIEDFVFSGKGRILHCRNVPSPGATSSLAIAELLAERVQNQFDQLNKSF